MGENGRSLVAQPLANSKKLCYDWDKQHRVIKRISAVSFLSFIKTLQHTEKGNAMNKSHKKTLSTVLTTVGLIVLSIAVFLLIVNFGLYAITYGIAAYMGGPAIRANEVLEPAVTYAEFDVRFEYLLDGERKVIEDTIVCQYEGVEIQTRAYAFNVGEKYNRLWKWYAKSSGDSQIVLRQDDEGSVCYWINDPGRYMGDLQYPSYLYDTFYFKAKITLASGENVEHHVHTAEELKQYGIEMIEMVLPEPIENSFE